MKTDNLVMLLVGMALMANGFFLFTKRSYAEWSLKLGRAQIWVKLLGLERAVKLTRYGFAPLSFLLGFLAAAGAALVTLVHR